MEKTDKMLAEETFWSIIEASLNSGFNQDNQERLLIKTIEKLTPEEIIGFRLRTDQLLFKSYNSDILCAAYLMNGDSCSDDLFHYFRNWLISRGKTVYYAALKNADSLISQFDVGEKDSYEFELFWYVACEAFKIKTGKNLYDYISDDFAFTESEYYPFQSDWDYNQPEMLRDICPKLYAQREAFDRNSPKKETEGLAVNDQMLDEDKYWKIIENSLVNKESLKKPKLRLRNRGDEGEQQKNLLVSQLTLLSAKDIVGFRLRTDKLLFDMYNYKTLCAAYIIIKDCDFLVFDFFIKWIITRGKKAYYNAKENPDSLIDEIKNGKGPYLFEEFWFIIQMAFSDKSGKGIEEFIPKDFKYNEWNYPEIDFMWEEEDPEKLRAVCPNLFEYFRQ